MLKIKNLTKQYGEFKAVDDLTLEIPSGSIYGFIGHNGAGKTTTLKSIAGLLPIEQGNITVDNISLENNALEVKKIIAYLPDNPDLYEYLSGAAYLNFIGDVFGISAKDREERIHKYADMFELTKDLAQPISSYSHGMKQKLAIISAFIHQPKLLLMDEPFVGLDPKTSKELKELMREFCDQGNAIFFSTHVLEVAEKLCDHIAIIKKGKLVVSGKTQEVIGNESLEDFFLDIGDDNA
ncbi:ABC transporter ATP-binding protein [Tannockella kyphosi]|uniref:ABC transporter ATP-binding protein n=1 Tax=Tannockella kyphosi TaxID=2899121 RepID=UPI00201222FF|nr:ABC transporter ATP-binding protein [Tannockella kyphosi]